VAGGETVKIDESNPFLIAVTEGKDRLDASENKLREFRIANGNFWGNLKPGTDARAYKAREEELEIARAEAGGVLQRALAAYGADIRKRDLAAGRGLTPALRRG